MNSRNDKLNYIKKLIREQVQSELNGRRNALKEYDDPIFPRLEIDSAEGGATLFIYNVSKAYKSLNLVGFKKLEEGDYGNTKDVAENKLPYIKIIVKLDDANILLRNNNFKFEYTADTITLKLIQPKPLTGVVNIYYPKTVATVTTDLDPFSYKRSHGRF